MPDLRDARRTNGSRSARHKPVRPRSISPQEVWRDVRRAYAAGEERSGRRLPLLRGDCERGHRPCVYTTCRHNLYVDVNPSGALKLNHPDLEPWQMHPSCALDVADLGRSSLEDVARLLNITRERARQIEVAALRKLRMNTLTRRTLADFRGHESAPEGTP